MRIALRGCCGASLILTGKTGNIIPTCAEHATVNIGEKDGGPASAEHLRQGHGESLERFSLVTVPLPPPPPRFFRCADGS